MITDANRDLVLKATNIHCEECGRPPAVTNDDPDRYYVGYFEGRFGDQWIFQYDRETERGVLRGGDLGWDEEIEVHDGRATEVVLGEEERRWLYACWRAAKGGEESPPPLLPEG